MVARCASGLSIEFSLLPYLGVWEEDKVQY